MTLDPVDMCLGCVYQGIDAMQSGNFEKAELLFRMADKQARSMPPDRAIGFALLVQCHMSVLRHRLGKAEEGKKLHESAMTLLDEHSDRLEAVALQDPVARVLMRLQEYRRALPFWERLIQNDSESNDPTEMVTALAFVGQCYGLMGLKDHSAIPARAALKILRDYPGDPRLPGVLITLGNALRKSSPSEAESLYGEATAYYETKAHFESATTAWSNLGILCSENGRYA